MKRTFRSVAAVLAFVTTAGMTAGFSGAMGAARTAAEPGAMTRAAWMALAKACVKEIKQPSAKAAAWAEIAVEEHAGGDDLMTAMSNLQCTGAVGLAEATRDPSERVLAVTSMVGVNAALGEADGLKTSVQMLVERAALPGVSEAALGEGLRTLASADEAEAALAVAAYYKDDSARTLAVVDAASLAKSKATNRALVDVARKGIEGRAGDNADVFSANVQSRLIAAAIASGDTRLAGLLSGVVRVPEYRVKAALLLARAAAEKGDGETCQKYVTDAAEALGGCAFAKARWTAELGDLLADVGSKEEAARSLKRFDDEKNDSPAGLLVAATVAVKTGNEKADQMYSGKATKAPAKEKAELGAEWLRLVQARAAAKDGFRALIAAAEIVGPEKMRYRPSAYYAAGQGLEAMGITHTHKTYIDLILDPEDRVYVALGIASALREKPVAEAAGNASPATRP